MESRDGNEPRATAGREMADAVGPVYDLRDVQELLGGLAEDEVNARVMEGSILCLTTSDNVRVYPAAQFSAGDVDQALVAALVALRDAPRWSLAVWLSTSNPDLGGVAPLEWAKTGRPAGVLLAAAQRTAIEWQ